MLIEVSTGKQLALLALAPARLAQVASRSNRAAQPFHTLYITHQGTHAVPAHERAQALSLSVARQRPTPRYIMHMPHAALSANWMPFSAMVVEMPVVQGRWLTLA